LARIHTGYLECVLLMLIWVVMFYVPYLLLVSLFKTTTSLSNAWTFVYRTC